MKRRAHDTWPPLIVASEIPRWVIWRDFGLTLAMWVMFAFMLATEFELIVGRNLARLGFGEFRTDAQWGIFFERLAPYLALVAVLLLILGITTIATLRRIRRAMRLAPAPPLTPLEMARRVGMTADEMAAARALRIGVVFVEPDGKHRVESRTFENSR